MAGRRRKDETASTGGRVFQPGGVVSSSPRVSKTVTVQPSAPVRAAPLGVQIARGIVTGKVQLDGRLRPGVQQSGVRSEIVTGNTSRAAPRASIAERYFSKRVEHPSGPTMSRNEVAKSEGIHKPVVHAMEKRKPGEFVSQARGVDMRPDGGNACLRANRPVDTKGDGSSRPFVPWCQKGKGKRR